MEGQAKNLLEKIQSCSGMDYLSDLRSASFSEDEKKKIRKIAVEKFTLEEWQDALQYIRPECGEVKTAEEAINSILCNE